MKKKTGKVNFIEINKKMRKKRTTDKYVKFDNKKNLSKKTSGKKVKGGKKMNIKKKTSNDELEKLDQLIDISN